MNQSLWLILLWLILFSSTLLLNPFYYKFVFYSSIFIILFTIFVQYTILSLTFLRHYIYIYIYQIIVNFALNYSSQVQFKSLPPPPPPLYFQSFTLHKKRRRKKKGRGGDRADVGRNGKKTTNEATFGRKEEGEEGEERGRKKIMWQWNSTPPRKNRK